ncbi:alanine racemase [Amphibacillus sediminis]|uniref:alanine racemase n=1 Tax=Amphibacillus sediminis TaxID=360185 RepID=UPI00082E4700|nr:alanine racemase [Amphibacillus sediminis]
MDPLLYRKAWININLAAISANINQLKKQLPNQTAVMAVVKANGYGHGDIQVAQAALAAGASGLAVALLEEAVRLRKAGIKAPILVMGWVAPEFARIAIEYQITLTVFQVSWLETFKQNKIGQPLSIHLKLDTGMGRLGIRSIEELRDFMAHLAQCNINLTGVYTHFATADEPNHDYYYKQSSRFETLINELKQHTTDQMVVHTGNSAAAIQHSNDMLNAVRFGIGMYGLYPSLYLKETQPISLEPALSLHAKLTHVKKVGAGESISYGATYTTEQEEWIGTIPVGYADGIQRGWQGLSVLINGKKMPLIGRICMDQCMVKLDQAYPIGTEVTFIGKQGNEKISMEEIAQHLGTINYEVACLLTNRLPRFYDPSDTEGAGVNF